MKLTADTMATILIAAASVAGALAVVRAQTTRADRALLAEFARPYRGRFALSFAFGGGVTARAQAGIPVEPEEALDLARSLWRAGEASDFVRRHGTIVFRDAAGRTVLFVRASHAEGEPVARAYRVVKEGVFQRPRFDPVERHPRRE
jgi:hypothetical protein